MTAASANSRVCREIASSVIATIACTPGTRKETLPKSVLPAKVRGTTSAGNTRRPRSAYRRVQLAANGPLVRTGRYAGDSSQRSSTPHPAISAAPWAMSASRSLRIARLSGYSLRR